MVGGRVLGFQDRGGTRYRRCASSEMAARKTKAGLRTVKLPPFAAATLKKKICEERPEPDDMLFPSSTGTVRSPHNFRRQWRDARADPACEWVTPHVFRKSVATPIDQKYSSKQPSPQLGHTGTAIMEKHYIAKASETPHLTDALQKLGQQEPPEEPGS